MKKVGRNDPCPCGSGRKYKKCHGASNVIKINPKHYNDQLAKLQSDLIEFSFSEYSIELQNIVEERAHPDTMNNQDLFTLYNSALISWAIFHQRLDNGKTIFEIYYQNQKMKIKNERVKKVFASWEEAPITFYKILDVNHTDLLIEDIRTNKTYQIEINEEDDFEIGSLLTGLIIPFVQEYKIFLSVFELSDEYGDQFRKIEKLTDHELKDYYPEILGEIIVEENLFLDIEFDHYQYYQTAHFFEQQMHHKNAGNDLIQMGKMIWKMYTDREFPIIRKPESYAAALEYVLQTRVLKSKFQTQKELADDYQVTASTISKNARQISETLDLELDDLATEIVTSDVDVISEPTPLSKEQSMRDLQKLLDEHEFESDQQAIEFLDQVLNNPDITPANSISPRDRAEDKLFEAQQAYGPKRKKLIQEALEIYPNSPEAYLLLAEDEKDLNRQYDLVQHAVQVGKEDLGEAFFKENTGHFWLMLETRPFMRAKAKLASFHVNHGDISDGIAEFEDLLVLNPNDNQGIRYILLTLYIAEKRYKEAQHLIEQFKDEKTAFTLFSHTLINYHTEGLTAKTRKLLEEADQQNPHVKIYLTKKAPLPNDHFDYIGIGDETEAITYVQENSELWRNVTPLLNELAKM